MKSHLEGIKFHEGYVSASNSPFQRKADRKSAFNLEDNRPDGSAKKKLMGSMTRMPFNGTFERNEGLPVQKIAVDFSSDGIKAPILQRKPFSQMITQLAKHRKEGERQSLKIGYRPGWPGTRMAHYVTHAVFKTNGGTVMGYGKPDKAGTIAPDNNIPPGVNYTWFDPGLLLSPKYMNLFLENVSIESAGFYYTGVGGNCFTPIHKALNTVKATMISNNVSKGNVDKVDNVISQLKGSNFGMGTTITNKMLMTALSVGAIALATYKMLGMGVGFSETV